MIERINGRIYVTNTDGSKREETDETALSYYERALNIDAITSSREPLTQDTAVPLKAQITKLTKELTQKLFAEKTTDSPLFVIAYECAITLFRCAYNLDKDLPSLRHSLCDYAVLGAYQISDMLLDKGYAPILREVVLFSKEGLFYIFAAYRSDYGLIMKHYYELPGKERSLLYFRGFADYADVDKENPALLPHVTKNYWKGPNLIKEPISYTREQLKHLKACYDVQRPMWGNDPECYERKYMKPDFSVEKHLLKTNSYDADKHAHKMEVYEKFAEWFHLDFEALKKRTATYANPLRHIVLNHLEITYQYALRHEQFLPDTLPKKDVEVYKTIISIYENINLNDTILAMRGPENHATTICFSDSRALEKTSWNKGETTPPVLNDTFWNAYLYAGGQFHGSFTQRKEAAFRAYGKDFFLPDLPNYNEINQNTENMLHSFWGKREVIFMYAIPISAIILLQFLPRFLVWNYMVGASTGLFDVLVKGILIDFIGIQIIASLVRRVILRKSIEHSEHADGPENDYINRTNLVALLLSIAWFILFVEFETPSNAIMSFFNMPVADIRTPETLGSYYFVSYIYLIGTNFVAWLLTCRWFWPGSVAQQAPFFYHPI